MADTAQIKEPSRAIVATRSECRLCGSTHVEKIWSFGATPLANEYILPQDVSTPEPFAPLDVYQCMDCHLVQLLDVVDPKILFSNYLYVSSTSPTFVAHFETYAATLIQRFALGSADLVVDIGSNDGVLLKPLQRAGVKVLGIEPAANIARQANADGVETVAEFLTKAVAEKLVREHGTARVIAANNVFAHTDGVAGMVEAIKVLLAPNGVFVFEVQYLGDLLDQNLFDIVYHEHVCYYHLHPLVKFFRHCGLEVFDVERQAVHGGSLRVYVARHGVIPVETRVTQLLAQEEAAELNTLKPYQEFAQRIIANKQKLAVILAGIKAQGKIIAGYGAPAKATTLTYVFGIDRQILDYIVDDSPLKQGRLMPGTHIPIVSPQHFSLKPPDYCLILAWNFAEPIMENNASFASTGGQWIIPVPTPRIV